MSRQLVVVTGLFLQIFFAAGISIGLADADSRRIPWDCSDWAAYAHENRTIAILESLAENRGKALYCGVDQSETFTKAETWAAGRDRNERDNTIYYGERGHFRGFIAIQEGWLTEGESGITGYPPERIFEFPKKPEEKRRVIRIYEWLPIQSRPPPARPLAQGPNGGVIVIRPAGATQEARAERAKLEARENYLSNPPDFQWSELARSVAREHCRSLDYPRARNVKFRIPMLDPENGWRYTPDTAPEADLWRWRAYQVREWRAVCERNQGRRIERRVLPYNPLDLPAEPGRRVRSRLGETITGRYELGSGPARSAARSRWRASQAGWDEVSVAAAREHCRSLGYHHAINVLTYTNPDNAAPERREAWGYTPNRATPPDYEWEAFKTREWSATCDNSGGFGPATGPPGPPIGVRTSSRAHAEEQAQISYEDNTPVFEWAAVTRAAARAHCRALGYGGLREVVSEVYAYTPDTAPAWNVYQWSAFRTRHWSATCQKTSTRRE